MEDIFQKALSGDKSAAIGLYTCSVKSAYDCLQAVLADEAKSTELVKQIYVAAFTQAQSYDEFFALLNKRALSACRLVEDKTDALAPIVAGDSVFARVEEMEIPQELKGFGESLYHIVSDEKKAQKAKKPLRRGRKHQAGKDGSLEEFAELVKKHEFSKIDSYRAPVEEKAPEPKKLADKMKNEEPLLSDEQKQLELIEMRKNERAAMIAMIFATIILIGSVMTYVISANIKEYRAKRAFNSNNPQTTTETLSETTYAPEDEEIAFSDYKGALVEKYGLASTERIVAYTQNSTVGADQLNGILSTSVQDFDGDGNNEMAVVRVNITKENNVRYTYCYLLEMCRFDGARITPLVSDYPLMQFVAENKSKDYTLNAFRMYLKLIKTDKPYLFAAAESKDFRACAFHYFEADKMHEGEKFVRISDAYNPDVYLQKYSDGTYQVLLIENDEYVEKDISAISDEYMASIKAVRIVIGEESILCSSKKELKTYFNKCFSRVGLKADKNLSLQYDSEDAKDYLCTLQADCEQGDKLAYKEVVQLTDYSKKN